MVLGMDQTELEDAAVDGASQFGTRVPANQIYTGPVYADNDVDRNLGIVGQENPYVTERFKMQHGRYLSGFGDFNPNEEMDRNESSIYQMEKDDDTAGSGIFDPVSRDATYNEKSGVFKADYSYPGYVDREVPFAQSSDLKDITTGATVSYAPGGGMVYIGKPQDIVRFGSQLRTDTTTQKIGQWPIQKSMPKDIKQTPLKKENLVSPMDQKIAVRNVGTISSSVTKTSPLAVSRGSQSRAYQARTTDAALAVSRSNKNVITATRAAPVVASRSIASKVEAPKPAVPRVSKQMKGFDGEQSAASPWLWAFWGLLGGVGIAYVMPILVSGKKRR